MWITLPPDLRLTISPASRRDHEAALRRLGRARQLATAIDSPIWQARALHQLAEVHSERGHKAAAASARAEVRELLASIGAEDPDLGAGVPAGPTV
ncbi:hypothetical protein [Nonomuraea sp. NPDC049400]|uniref:hypothetical protein n=1 Tax=Nonomuraea sp. NPDC049400 TaxID=3364352 RepID=UPI0037A02CF9